MNSTEAPIEAPEAPKPKKKTRVRGDALTRLAKASRKAVRNQSEEIVKALVVRVLLGDVNCTKLLIALIERLPPPKRKHHQHRPRVDKGRPMERTRQR